MIIHKINFPIYSIIILISLIIGIIYIYNNLRKEGIEKRLLFYFFFLFIVSAYIFGIIYTLVINNKPFNINNIGLSSLGAALGVILSAIIFEYIVPSDKKFIKYTIISLPLIYGLSKIACAVVGCCYGIPYEGFLSIKYIDVLDQYVFPVQLLEVILNIILFIIMNHMKNNKNIIYITLISASIIKFFTDFLRYEHINKIITSNQIVCLLVIIITIVYFISKHKGIRH